MYKSLLIVVALVCLFTASTHSQNRSPKGADTVVVIVNTRGDSICIDQKQTPPPRTIFKLDSLQDRIYKDTISHKYIKIDSTKSSKHISNIIVKNLFSTPNEASDSTLKKISKFDEYQGRTIESVVIVRDNIFPEDKTSILHKSSNSINTIIRESTVRRYLLFKEGDKVVPEDLIKSEALLRSMGAISKSDIQVENNDNGNVTIYVSTTDSWSITAQLYYRTTNNGMMQVSDQDFLGTGNRLDINEYFNISQKDWFKGAELNYFMPNVFGKFIEVNIGGGYGKDFHSALLSADKFFVMPNDFAGGIKYNRRREDMHVNFEDIFVPIDKQLYNVWFGQSINISKKWGDNIFYTAKLESVKYFDRPYQSKTYSPDFHNSNDILLSFGFYKEKFYRGNLIYGYGRTESIPYGYKAELIGGYRQGEYDSAPYIGTNLSIGNMMRVGYISAKISFGSFIGNKESLNKTKLDVGLLYFSKLQNLKREVSFRQFLNLNYSSGIRSMVGFSEEYSFQNSNLLSSVSQNARGTTRLNINPETVFFTPLHISGFKFALFGFTDVGTIGYSVNPFENKFYAVAGCGVRIRNESLIFKTIQFRVIVALKGDREFRNNLFYLNSEPPLKANRYIPMEPQIIRLK